MSQKKSKSKSKDKEKADKPPKDAKEVKSKKGIKEDKGDNKSKKSVEKTQKAPKKAKAQKSEKPPAPQQLDLSQDNFSDFLKNPFSYPPAISTDDALCPHHKQPTTLFCQICEQTGCEKCIVYGPHNNQMHRVARIDQAFQARYLYLNELVCGGLLQKRDKLTKYLDQLTVLGDQLRYVKNGIQKMTKIEFIQMLQRLKTNAGGKFAVLHHQMADLQRDLQAINALGNQFFELTNLNPIAPNNTQPTPKAIVPFLLRSRYLQQQAQNLIAKPIKTSVDVYPYDLPRQLTEKKLILQKNKGWVQLLKVKDQTLWSLAQQKKGIRNKIIENLNQEAKAQISQWRKLKQRIQEQLQTLQMRCKNCDSEANQQTVNDQCVKGGYHTFVR